MRVTEPNGLDRALLHPQADGPETETVASSAIVEAENQPQDHREDSR